MTDTEKQLVFEDLFLRHFHQLYIHALGWVREEESAKDVVHDAFAYLWEHFDRYAPDSNYLALLYTFVRSRCADWLRHEQTASLYAEQQQTLAPEPADDYDTYDERLEQVKRAIRQLPPQTRRVCVACLLQHHTYKEAAEQLGISPLTVKTLMARALKALRTPGEG